MAHPNVLISNILHRDIVSEPLKVVSRKNIQYQLESGKTIIVAPCGPSASVPGHGHPEVTAAILKQLNTVQYVHSSAPFASKPSETLASFILEGKPGGLTKAIFLNSGSGAMNAALKLVTQYWHEKGE